MQVAGYSLTHIHLTYVVLHEVAWLYGVHRTCTKMAAVSCGTSHANTVSTPLQWLLKKKKNAIKLVTHFEPHVSAVSLLKGAENSAI